MTLPTASLEELAGFRRWKRGGCLFSFCPKEPAPPKTRRVAGQETGASHVNPRKTTILGPRRPCSCQDPRDFQWHRSRLHTKCTPRLGHGEASRSCASTGASKGPKNHRGKGIKRFFPLAPLTPCLTHTRFRRDLCFAAGQGWSPLLVLFFGILGVLCRDFFLFCFGPNLGIFWSRNYLISGAGAGN